MAEQVSTKILMFVPRPSNGEVDDELNDRERAVLLEEISRRELVNLDIDRLVDGLVLDDVKYELD